MFSVYLPSSSYSYKAVFKDLRSSLILAQTAAAWKGHSAKFLLLQSHYEFQASQVIFITGVCAFVASSFSLALLSLLHRAVWEVWSVLDTSTSYQGNQAI